MDWALFLTHISRLSLIDEPWRDNKLIDLSKQNKVCHKLFGDITFSRLYFGQEFCARLLPSPYEVRKALEKAQQKGWQFTLVTPYVTEHDIGKIHRLMKELQQTEAGCEVVVNDWGVLSLIAKEYQKLTPVLGRLLNKMWRDPRLQQYLGKKAGEDALDPLRSSILQSPQMKGLLAKHRVNRIELDYPPQGLGNVSTWGYEISLYFPFVCITTGRICLLGSKDMEKQDKFRATAPNCSHGCLDSLLLMTDKTGNVKDNKDKLILQKGNTIFYLGSEKMAEKALIDAREKGIDRLIYQPEP